MQIYQVHSPYSGLQEANCIISNDEGKASDTNHHLWFFFTSLENWEKKENFLTLYVIYMNVLSKYILNWETGDGFPLRQEKDKAAHYH